MSWPSGTFITIRLGAPDAQIDIESGDGKFHTRRAHSDEDNATTVSKIASRREGGRTSPYRRSAWASGI